MQSDFPTENKQHSAGDPTRFLLGTGTGGLQSPSHKGDPKNTALKKSGSKIPAKKSGPKVEPHAVKPSVLRHREKMREYMRRRREAAKAKQRQPIDPNIIHPNVADGNPSPEEVE